LRVIVPLGREGWPQGRDFAFLAPFALPRPSTAVHFGDRSQDQAQLTDLSSLRRYFCPRYSRTDLGVRNGIIRNKIREKV